MFNIDHYKRNLKDCPECNEDHWIYDDRRGEILCFKCGYVIEQKIIDLGPDWRSYSNKETKKRAHTGATSKLAIYDKGLSTNVGGEDKDVFGNKIRPNMISQIKRLRRWQNRCRSSGSFERTMKEVLNLANSYISQLQLSNCGIDTFVAYYLRKIKKKNLIKGYSYEIVVLATIYMCCRQNKIPISLNDIIKTFHVKKRNLNQYYLKIKREFPIISTLNPLLLISKYCNKLGISENCSQLAQKIIIIAREKGIIQGSPSGIAAGAIYFASYINSEHVSQHIISKIANISKTTLKTHYRNLIKNINVNDISIFI